MNRTMRRNVLGGAVALSLVMAACGSDEGGSSDTTAAADGEATTTGAASSEAPTTGGGSGGGVNGTVLVSGSSTVEPISIIVGEKFKAANPDAGVTIDGPGTGDGFKLFCAGETDISNASRPIRDDPEEKGACDAAGIEYTELAIGIDGLTVATNPANADVECLDIPALYALLGPESEGIDNWSGANTLATEVGSAYTTLPDAPLVVSGPGEESGTYDSFVEFAIAGLAEERGQDAVVRADYNSSPNDNVIVQGIEGADSSLGWVGFAYYAAEQERMKGLQIDGGEGCVAPSVETIGDGTYPFSRTLYIYVNNAKAAENPAVKAFVDLQLSEDGLASVTEAGYVDLPAEELTATQDAWAAAGGG